MHCLNIGAGDSDGSFLFTNSKGPENHLVVNNHEGDSGLISVNVKRLDSLNLDGNPTFIKIDTEGSELSVLRGAINTLKLDSMVGVLVETNGNNIRYKETDSEILNFMQELNYLPYCYDVLNRKLNKRSQIRTKGNTLFIKNIQEASRKIKKEKHNNLWGFEI